MYIREADPEAYFYEERDAYPEASSEAYELYEREAYPDPYAEAEATAEAEAETYAREAGLCDECS